MTSYVISFETKEYPGRMSAVRVRLDRILLRDMKKQYNLALCDDPLYKDLERYVLSNLGRKTNGKSTD